MNAQRQIEKLEKLAEAAYKSGAYACARRWDSKLAKLEAAVSALETTVEEEIMEFNSLKPALKNEQVQNQFKSVEIVEEEDPKATLTYCLKNSDFFITLPQEERRAYMNELKDAGAVQHPIDKYTFEIPKSRKIQEITAKYFDISKGHKIV